MLGEVLAGGKNLLHISHSYRVQIESDFGDTVGRKSLGSPNPLFPANKGQT